jgi:hypothetical protein
MGVANAVPGPGSEYHPRQEIDCTDTSADIPASGGCLFFFVLEAKRSAWTCRCVLLRVCGHCDFLGWLMCRVEPHAGHNRRSTIIGLELMEGESR